MPAGTPVHERPKYPPAFPADEPSYAGVYQELPEGELHLTVDVSLPFVGTVELPGPPWSEPLPGHPHSEALAEVWEDQWGGAPLLIGGYGTDYNGVDSREVAARLAVKATEAGYRQGPTSAYAADWVLLAECDVDRPGASATIYWLIQRDDLAARHFGRVQVLVYWNP